MSLWSVLKGKGVNGFGYGSTAEAVTDGLDLSGKTFLVTGCNSGLGLETLRVLSLRGGHVIAAARTVEKAQTAIESVEADGTPVACELSDPTSVRECVATVEKLDRPLDAIICNAGIMALPKLEQKHGYELQFFTNHIGHFILVTGLLGSLAEDGRAVIVSSSAHKRAPEEGIQFDNLSGESGYKPWKAYGQSKLANVLFASQLAKNMAGTKQTAFSLHPGVIRTNLVRHMNPAARVVMAIGVPLFLKTIPQGAATQCYLATQPGAPEFSGEYFSDCNVEEPKSYGDDDAMAQELWTVSEEIVAKLD